MKNWRITRVLMSMADTFLARRVTRSAAELAYCMVMALFPAIICIYDLLALILRDPAAVLRIVETLVLPRETQGSVDDVIYIPYANAQRLGGGYGDMYLMTSTDRDTASAAKGIIENRLFKTYQSSDYYMVMTSAEMMDAMDSMLNTLMMILILYRLTTPRRPQHRVLPGAVFSAVAIVCMSILLSWLIGNSTKYSLVYGSLASAVILLFWFQAFGLLLILGVLLNHALEVTAEQEP